MMEWIDTIVQAAADLLESDVLHAKPLDLREQRGIVHPQPIDLGDRRGRGRHPGGDLMNDSLERTEGETDPVLDLAHGRIRGERHQDGAQEEQGGEGDPPTAGGPGGEERGHRDPLGGAAP